MMMSDKNITTDKATCKTVISVLEQFGVRHAVCSPGSRNAPLLMAIAASEMETTVIIDERTAAFTALGMALALNEPVALACTSGTALLNYSPAIAEAYYRHVPIIVISADRPHEWIDQDDSQTLRQFEALRNYVKKSYDLPDTADGNTWYADRVTNDAMSNACGGCPGPVHINLQLDAPLSGINTDRIKARKITGICGSDEPSADDMSMLAGEYARSRVLFVAGFLRPDRRIDKAMEKLASLPNTFVMTESISNINVPEICRNIDTLLINMTSGQMEELKPDIVITLGGALVSRKIKEYLRGCRNMRHWTIGKSRTTVDCFKHLSLRIDVNAEDILPRLGELLSKHNINSNYSALWHKEMDSALERHKAFVDNAPWCDMTAFAAIFKHLPDYYALHLSNGTPIRYAQLFTTGKERSVWCNRGVSGIDGCTSTAIGFAMMDRKPTLLISGDTSFSYDIGALLISRRPENFKIIVIDNSGGDIFRFISATDKMPIRERFLSAPQNINYEQIAKAFNIRYFNASSKDALEEALPFFFSVKGDAMLVVSTPAETNSTVLKAYMCR